ncbi:MAG: hypothetical protein HY744_20550 [Deltaproteobacteria bacterium]|nr:hypothetical protein [Deltaproteobacteria bacterium]
MQRHARRLPPADACRPLTPAALRNELRRLGRAFADQIFGLVERQGLPGKRLQPARGEPAPGRVRRSAAELRELGERIVVVLRARREPMSIGAIAAELGATAREIAHPALLLVRRGVLARTGERRGARYELVPRRPAGRPRGDGGRARRRR